MQYVYFQIPLLISCFIISLRCDLLPDTSPVRRVVLSPIVRIDPAYAVTSNHTADVVKANLTTQILQILQNVTKLPNNVINAVRVDLQGVNLINCIAILPMAETQNNNPNIGTTTAAPGSYFCLNDGGYIVGTCTGNNDCYREKMGKLPVETSIWHITGWLNTSNERIIRAWSRALQDNILNAVKNQINDNWMFTSASLLWEE